MLDIEPRKVLVCVSPGEDCEASLELAVAEARRRGCGLHLALVVRSVAGAADRLRLVEGEWRAYGADFLDGCERRVAELGGGSLLVTTEVAHGLVVPSLVEVSEHAGLVVLQHHRMHRTHVVPTLSVTNGVAARAHAPAVAVPDDWRESAASSDVVVVGVDDASSSAPVVRWAFEEAERLGGGVRLVRAWSYSPAFDAQVFTGPAEAAETDIQRAEVLRQLAGVIEGLPDVPHEVVAVHGQPADVLVRHSVGARRLVVGRHRPILPVGSHLGPVARAVLGHAACPVVVVDPREATTTAPSRSAAASAAG